MYRLSIPCAGNSTTQLAGGLGCVQCGGTCGQGHGLGLFDSGLDFSGWTLTDWAVVAFGGYVFLSIINDTRRIASRAARGAKGLKRKLRRRRRRSIRPMQGESLI
jgi:hypothetical protein